MSLWISHSVISAIAHDFHELHGAESDNSFGDSDEPIMEHMTEGGVTIHKRKFKSKVGHVMYVRSYY